MKKPTTTTLRKVTELKSPLIAHRHTSQHDAQDHRTGVRRAPARKLRLPSYVRHA